MILDPHVRPRLTSGAVTNTLDPVAVLRIRHGAAIRRRRIELGLTLTAFAGVVGVSKATASQWEHGVISPSMANQLAIAEALQLPHPDLFRMDPA